GFTRGPASARRVLWKISASQSCHRPRTGESRVLLPRIHRFGGRGHLHLLLLRSHSRDVLGPIKQFWARADFLADSLRALSVHRGNSLSRPLPRGDSEPRHRSREYPEVTASFLLVNHVHLAGRGIVINLHPVRSIGDFLQITLLYQ